MRLRGGSGRFVAVAAVVAVLAAACGNDDSTAEQDEEQVDAVAINTLIDEAPEGLDFYEPPESLAEAEPGDVLWATELDPVEGGRVWQVLYRSESLTGDPIAVSGWIAVPDGPAPDEGRPVLAWAHGTKGVADICAPTQAQTPDDEIPYLEDFLARGFVVTASDYEGLGTPGLHPYTVGESEAHAVLDSARAAQRFVADGVGDDVILFGHSQGGHAVIFANEFAEDYAPELEVQGVASSGSGVFAIEDDIIGFLIDSPFRGVLVIVAASHEAAYGSEEAPLSRFLTDQGIEEAEAVLETGCWDDVIDHFEPFEPEEIFVADAPLPTASGVDLTQENAAGSRVGSAPLLMVHGAQDEIIPPAGIAPWAESVCEIGQVVWLEWYPGGHRVVYDEPDAQPFVLDWIDARLAGEEPPSSCGAVPPVPES